MKAKKNSKEEKKKKIWLPIFVFLLFFGSSLAYFSIFNTPTYTDEFSKIVNDYVKKKYDIKPIYSTTSSENDICYIVSVFVSQDKGLNVCITKDKKFISPFFYSRNSEDIYEDLEIINFNFNLPINFKDELKLINKTKYYQIYKIEKVLGDLGEKSFILISNNTIVMFAEPII
ncbi:MAG TPA: hypothetical protein EYH54_01550 [Nautiliaceae bacterium]|nr:hypothetical protein [Nautiliaceae bacterium]